MFRRYSYAICFTVLFIGMVQIKKSMADQENKGTIDCKVLENGKSASGVISLKRDGQEVLKELCKKDIPISIGTYSATISLDGVLNSPEQRKEVTVKKGRTTKVTADFPTGILEVQIQSKGRNAAGMAIIRQNNLQIGTLGSGVSAHISTGTYQVIARYRTQKKSFENVVITPEKQVVLKATFE